MGKQSSLVTQVKVLTIIINNKQQAITRDTPAPVSPENFVNQNVSG